MEKLNSGCHVMTKPTGSTCNIDCTYCFYLEKYKLYPESKQKFMDDETLEIFIRQQIEAQSSDTVDFAWQGGEPTLAGIEFYEKAIQLQKKYAKNKKIVNVMQTNGLLLNKAWCQLFKRNDWLIGISIDGPEELHNAYRVTRSGKGTHHKVIKAIELLKHHKIEFNILAVVNSLNVKQPEKVYKYLKSLGTPHIQFIPLVEREDTNAESNEIRLIGPDFVRQAQVTKWSVPSLQYGEFLSRIFDIWVKNDIGKVFVQIFETTLATTCGYPAQVCIFSEKCGHAFALEANGDLYNCDHYVYPEHKLGNIHEQSITTMNNSDHANQFGEDKKDKIAEDCKTCAFLEQCHGDCPKHRFIASSTGEHNLSYFCEGLFYFFKHSAPYMKTMKGLLETQQSPALLMNILRN